MSEILLQVKDLRTYFYTTEGIIRATDGISYDVREAETVALVGESGCGKSVSALSVIRLIPYPGRIISGQVIFGGEDLLKVSEEKVRGVRGRHIAMVFQEPMASLNPVMCIGEQIAEPLRVHLKMEQKAAHRRVIELLRTIGIPDAEQRYQAYPHQFSGGMRQRVMIAMALSCNPEILIADEPTTALDVTIQAQVLDTMTIIARQMGTAVILITHNLGIVARYADRVNVMYAGRIVESGLSDNIYREPKHPYTVGLLQSVPRIDQINTQRLSPIRRLSSDSSQRPKGCYFQPQCPFALSICTQEYPPLEVVGYKHQCACFNKR
ncbi:MAG: ABC transporter ATP-binding protein [Dehalococcoidales bacterium]|nr:ABC transporter ATP-binding protein [Dehalococcoidales bacterium]